VVSPLATAIPTAKDSASINTKPAVPVINIRNLEKATGVTERDIYSFLRYYVNNYFEHREAPVAQEPFYAEGNTDKGFLESLIIQPKDTTMNTVVSVRPTVLSRQQYRFMLRQLVRYKGYQFNPDSFSDMLHTDKKLLKQDEGMSRFSIPLFTKDKRTVIFSNVWNCRGLCGGGSTDVYELKKGKWVRKQNLGMWVY
jgi:hypothetical protein